MHHNVVCKKLCREQFTEETIKEVNEKLSANVVMKKVFKGIKFDGTNAELIKQLVEENRLELISNTFCNANSGYKYFKIQE